MGIRRPQIKKSHEHVSIQEGLIKTEEKYEGENRK